LNVMKNDLCYGLSRPVQLRSSDGEKCEATAYVYRDPMVTMVEAIKLREELDRFSEEIWPKGNVKKDDYRLSFFKNPKKGKPLEFDGEAYDFYCYDKGFFAFLGNSNLSLEKALDQYSLRNESEVAFKQMLGNVLRTTRVHSTATLNGLAFTSFIGLSVLTDLRMRLRRKDAKGKELRSTYTIAEALKTLQKVMMVRDASGRCRLLNVTKKEKQLARELGFEGLFDSAESINKLLSARHLADSLGSSQS